MRAPAPVDPCARPLLSDTLNQIAKKVFDALLKDYAFAGENAVPLFDSVKPHVSFT